jgi:hypothetical protein
MCTDRTTTKIKVESKKKTEGMKYIYILIIILKLLLEYMDKNAQVDITCRRKIQYMFIPSKC